MNILITGASSGFGNEMAAALANAGHTVFAGMRALHGKNSNVALELRSGPGKIEPFELDVSTDSSVDAGIAHVLSALEGPLDVVINNAGVYIGGLNETVSSGRVQDLLNVNVVGAVRVMRAVLPNMREQGCGTLISITSGMSRYALPMSGLYAASKSALEVIAETYALELAPLGLESLIVQPGAFNTGIMQRSALVEEPERMVGYSATLGEVKAMSERYMALAKSSFFEASPALVAESVLELLNQPYGQRPMRTVVDPSQLGVLTSAMNEAISTQQSALLEALGVSFTFAAKEDVA